MSFRSSDLVPLWDRGPDFLPLRPPGGSHQWSFARVREELTEAAETMDKAAAERRVALLSAPGLAPGVATDGLNVGIQMLLPGESAAAHRHTPAALRIGLEGQGVVTTVDGVDHRLEPQDLVLNPTGTWHGHHAADGGLWLDVVDLPLVGALGGVLFEPSEAHVEGPLLDPPMGVPANIRYPWSEIEPLLDEAESVDGVRTFRYGGGEVLPTLAVTAFSVEAGATLELPAQTGGAVILCADGRFEGEGAAMDRLDVLALRAWTPTALRCASVDGGLLMTVDTSPALRRLGLQRRAVR